MPSSKSDTVVPLSSGISAIEPTKEYLAQLNSLVLPLEALSRAGFIVKELTKEQLDSRKRCKTCGVRSEYSSVIMEIRKALPSQGGTDDGNAKAVEAKAEKTVVHRCKRHTGAYIKSTKKWSCCGKQLNSPPCWGQKNHDQPVGQDEALQKRWQYHPTPTNPQRSHRLAVALDCEMGTAIDSETELIRVTVIDYFTGEKLVDSLVFPDIEMRHFNTRFSGVTRKDMTLAYKQHRCFLGGAAARAAVFKYVGPETIVVAHSANGDLGSLRWIHHKVVDTHILESERRKKEEAEKEKENVDNNVKDVKTEQTTASMGKRQGESEGKQDEPQKKPKVRYHPEGMSLKALTMKHLGREIQAAVKAGHDSFEDALASRDLLHYHITNFL
ncbi:hypothetical protein B0T16DRAFT_325862 [Cercophora newfieldiana]|uniref:Exonuclease domain-containing protein n=1 Tax=Cercophora newfieldiana TaxID=92897 RepID=A0AA39Y8W8_9PEZI|nr:hypothetical protein B0T16DRAFT_325862 [Cercophora newfieldiana]